MEKEKTWYLLTAYGDFNRKNPSKPDVDGSLQVLAAAEIWRQDRGRTVGGFVFTNRISYEETTFAEAMAMHLKRLIPSLPKQAVICEPIATTTRTELKAFKNITQERRIKNIAVIGKSWHLDRIGINVEREFKHTLPLYSTDEILRQANSGRYEGIIEKWNEQTEAGFRKREILIQFINKIPFTNGQLLEIIDRFLGNKKVKIEFGVGRLLRKKS